MEYIRFKNILNKQIFDNSKTDLIKKIATFPDRYIGLFRPTKPKAKILQNLLQSNEIRFGDALEVLFEEYFKDLKYAFLDKKIETENNGRFTIDQLFKDQKYIYFVEQKVRDDHDSSKKRGQIYNFEEKIAFLLNKYKENEIIAYMYFIDGILTKNKNFYLGELQKIQHYYNVKCELCYGIEFWEKINRPNIWDEIINYLTKWKQEIQDMPSINFDEDFENTFEEIKNINASIYRKLFENKKICDEILPILFPENKVLKLLKEYFEVLGKEKSIYKNLANLIKIIQ